MKFTMGIAAALATTSLAFAAGGGEGDKKKAANGPTKKTNSSKLERMAGTPLPMADAKVTAGAGEGFQITVGDDFSINVKNRVHAQWTFINSDAAADVNTFNVRRARTMLHGNVWDQDKTFFVQLDWNPGQGGRRMTNATILDGWFNWDFWSNENGDSIGVRLGAQKATFGREWTAMSNGFDHSDRSLASLTFSGNRVVGARVHGSMVENKLHWGVMAANGDTARASSVLEAGDNAANPDNELSFYGDVRFDPFGDMGDWDYVAADLEQTEELLASFGAAVQVGNHRNAGTDIETTGINLNAAMKVKGFAAQGEYFMRSDDPDVGGAQELDSSGFYVGGSYTLPAAEENGSQWSFAVRYGMVTNDDANGFINIGTLGNAAGDVSDIEGSVTNYYHKTGLRTTVTYRHREVEPDGGGSVDADQIDLLFMFDF